jgi:molybdate transport system regulatory protein
MTTRVTLRLDFDEGRRLGPGKIALLESIRDTGSISAAGRALQMSYRRAWLLVEDMNSMFAKPLVLARPGGAHGGGACLTQVGDSVVALYREAERETRRGASAAISRIERALAGTP